MYHSLSSAKIKLIRSLEQKKYRRKYRLFAVEGDKIVRELLASELTVTCVLAKAEWIEGIPAGLMTKYPDIVEITGKELSQISFLKTPNQAMALVKLPDDILDISRLASGLSIYLDQIQDPGNLGTIIRIADWFGIRHVLCGEGCVDPYNPKTVQSTMGAFARVKIYQAASAFFGQLEKLYPGFPVYGTFLDGRSLYREPLETRAVIVMGNESNGIGADVARYVNRRVLIPPYPPGEPASDSLNVAAAAAIVCAEFRRVKPD